MSNGSPVRVRRAPKCRRSRGQNRSRSVLLDDTRGERAIGRTHVGKFVGTVEPRPCILLYERCGCAPLACTLCECGRTLWGHQGLPWVIGDPVRHTLSPALHNAAFAHLGLDWTYVAFEVPAGRGGDAVTAMRVLGVEGLSVTMPHKDAAAAACDELSPAAELLGAVNLRAPRRRPVDRREHRRRWVPALALHPSRCEPHGTARCRAGRRRRGAGGNCGPSGRGGVGDRRESITACRRAGGRIGGSGGRCGGLRHQAHLRA